MSRGVWKDGWSRVAYLDIGPYRVRQFLASDQIGSAIEEASNDSAAVIRAGHYLFWRWGLSVSSGGHTERQGLFSFLFHSAVISFLFFLGAMLAGLIWGLLGWAVLGLWFAHMAMNVAARFGASTPQMEHLADR